ncbi:toll/interleukin-1 receptor domain-containing protein [Defluviicoccus vanus]|uniref:Toll/interleukin-1 receptor domain-containing protein n=1 Tax=Defluviicoccus vanus TaxID=111831 RepID=A0A7H1N5B8_9PROT|nr:toll/interleukin-1 receptor domain-containing protein [Defluviicoccus vanus]QNT70904.1 toll/interleukin-1 receptor domain-containing protein [Defluviicoccus vanus]
MDDNAGKAMPDIFISYAREDREIAELLARALEAEGWSVWWDRHIPAGKRFDEVISASLDKAKCVVALWSTAAIASQWVAEEAEEGKERGVFVPALIEAVEPPLGFRRIHAADLIGWTGDPGHAGLRQMIGDICTIISMPAPSADAATTESAAAPSHPSLSPTPSPRRRWRLPLIVGAGVLLLAAAVTAFLITPDRQLRVEEVANGAAGAHSDTAAPAVARIDGRWQGQVSYDWGLVQNETFSFRTVGRTLTGSAGFLGVARAMLNPRIEGDEVRFDVRWQETLGSSERDVVNHYIGALSGDRIDMVVTIEGGASPHPPIEFVISRIRD